MAFVAAEAEPLCLTGDPLTGDKNVVVEFIAKNRVKS